MHTLDRYLRLFIALVAAQLAFFWLSGWLQIAAWVLAGVMLLTASVRFCPAYFALRVRTCSLPQTPLKMAWKIVFIALLLATLVGGSVGSALWSRKIFLAEFNHMNHFYKQTLFYTGKNQAAESLQNYQQLQASYQDFAAKYSHYQPYALRGDSQLSADLAQVAGWIDAAARPITGPDLNQVHLDLEKIRPVFQDILKRNGLSMLSVALVDFHDAMEVLLEAAKAQHTGQVLLAWPQADEKMKAIEAEANDADIQAIRTQLDALLTTAQNQPASALPDQGEQLKRSFVKVYLQRG